MPVGSFFAGRAVLRRRGDGGSTLDFDGVDALALGVPLIPVAAVHVWDWRQTENAWSWQKRAEVFAFRSIPIRWSPELLLRTMLRFWLWAPAAVGLLYALSCAHGLIGRAFGWLYFLAAIGAWVGLKLSDARSRDVRLLLGRHRLGSSDPATWTADLRSLLAPAASWFGTPSFALAVEPLLQQSRFSEAMWAARLAVLDDPREGAQLTEQVLQDPRVAELLPSLRRGTAPYAKLLRRDHPRPFPLVQKADGPIAEFWYGKLFDNAAETLTRTTYAAHLGGQLAMAFDSDDDDEFPGATETPVAPAAAAENRLYALGGVSIVAGSVAACLGLFFLAELTRPAHPAFGPPVIVRPAPQPAAAPLVVPVAIAAKAEAQSPAEGTQPARVAAVADPPPLLPNAPAWARPDAGPWKYLADLEAFDVKEGPWRFAHDGTLGDPQMRPIYVGGSASPKGLAMHPPDAGFSAVKYRLSGIATRLKAAVALDDTVIFTQDTAIFEVWGDSQKLWQSPPLREKGQAHECVVDVAGIQTLELRVTARGSHFGLHAVWLEPRVLVDAPK